MYYSLLLQPQCAGLYRRLEGVKYTRPDLGKGAEEAVGVAAIKIINGLLSAAPKIDDSKGFWLQYELLTNGLSLKILADDQPHGLGSLLFRLCNHQTAMELVPLLRTMEAEPQLAAEMPKYQGTTGRKGVVGALGNKVGLFKGKAGAGIGDEILGHLQRAIPTLQAQGRPAWPVYQLAAAAPAAELPSLHELRRKHRTRLTPEGLTCDLEARWMPEAFEADAAKGGHVLGRSSPSRRGDGGGAEAAPPARGAGAAAGGPAPAARAVVARR